jgi:hypothetical protein
MQIFSYRRSRNTRATSKEICKIRLCISLQVTCIFLNQYSWHRSDRHKSRSFTFSADRLNTEFQTWGLGHLHWHIYCVKLKENFDYLRQDNFLQGIRLGTTLQTYPHRFLLRPRAMHLIQLIKPNDKGYPHLSTMNM